MTSPVSTFPRIIRFGETHDSPDSECPHCGANGRFILTFTVEDGRTLAAMRGCAKLFPTSRIALEDLRLQTKLKSLKIRFGESAKLNRNDAQAMREIEAFYSGHQTEDRALQAIDNAKKMNAAKYRR